MDRELGDGIEAEGRVVLAQRLRHRFRQSRRAHGAEGRIAGEAAGIEEAEEAAQAGEAARGRAAGEAVGRAAGEIGAEIRRRQPGKVGDVGRLAAIVLEKGEEAREIPAVAVDGMRRGPLLQRQMVEPGPRRAGDRG
jgi:hypothetical protein